MVSFGENLRVWRVFRGLTQEALAVQSGLPRPNLVALEQGRRECNLSTLYRLAYALEISPGRLIDETPLQQKLSALGRHEIDAIARNLLTGEGPLPSPLIPIKNQAAFEAGPLLRVAGAPKIPKSKPRSGIISGEAYKVLKRVRKLTASFISGGVDEKR